MTVMTMTSVSVIMAVMVINCYHRGQKFFRPPLWANRFILSWLASILQMQQDVAAAANAIQLVSMLTCNQLREVNRSMKNLQVVKI